MAFQYQGGNMMKGAALQGKQQQSLFDQLARGIQMGQQNQDRELKKKQLEMEQAAKANDPNTLGTEQILSDLMSQGMTRGEASAQLLNAKSEKMYQDEWGNLVRQPSIFDSLGLDRGRGIVPPNPNGGSNVAPQQPNSVIGQIPQQSGAAASLKGQLMQYQNDLDIKKEREKAKILMDKNALVAERDQSKADDDLLPVLKDMLSFNSKTLEMPYAGTAQPITRLTNQEAAENMALLKQRQLKIATPLAKQLGVNPTDKDFQNTLDQIFNENESRSTREKQIQSLITDIEKRQGKYDPKKQREEKSRRARRESEQVTPPKSALTGKGEDERRALYQKMMENR